MVLKFLIALSLLCGSQVIAFSLECDFVESAQWEEFRAEGLTGSHSIFVLSDTLNEKARTGEKVFLYELGPHAEIQNLAVHSSWEEVVILRGELAWLNQDEERSAQQVIEKGGYVDRLPGVEHGPFRSGKEGCLMVVRLHY